MGKIFCWNNLKRTQWRTNHRWKNNIKMHFMETRCEELDSILVVKFETLLPVSDKRVYFVPQWRFSGMSSMQEGITRVM
jgi:hypothetical protein